MSDNIQELIRRIDNSLNDDNDLTLYSRATMRDCKDQLKQQHQELSNLFTENDALGSANTQLCIQIVKKDDEVKHLLEGLEKIQTIANKNFVIGSYAIREITEHLLNKDK